MSTEKRSTSGDTLEFRRAQWRMLLAAMFCYLFYYTGRQTAGFAIPGIHEELGISMTTLGWMSAIMFWCYAAGQFFNGNLGDRFGGRLMMSLGALFSCALNWVTSFSFSSLSLFIPWGINGYAQSMGWAPGSRLISNWWRPFERGRAFGLYVFAAGMSSVLAFVTSLIILDVLHLSWRWIFRLPVLLMLVGGAVFFWIARNRPEDLGFEAISGSAAADSGTESSLGGISDGESPLRQYVLVLTNARFMIASVAIGFQNCARYGLLVWVPVYFLGDDWKQTDSTRWISVALPVGMAFGAMTSGWISDVVFQSRRSPVIIACMGSAAFFSFLMYLIPKEHWLAGFFCLFFAGFFVYGAQTAFWALAPDLLGPEHTGTGAGIMNFFAYAVAGLGEPFIGHMIESHDHQYGLVFPIVGVSCFIAAFISVFIRR